MEYMNANYLISTVLPINEFKPRISNVLIAKYKKIINCDTVEINLLTSRSRNMLFPNADGGIDVMKKAIPIKVVDLRYHHNYDSINDLIIEAARMFFKRTALKRNDYLIFINTHRIGKFQLLENAVYRKEIFTASHKDGTNVNLGVKYDVNDNLTISAKAYNVLGTRYKNSYFIFDFGRNKIDSLNIPLYERSVIFTVEYMF
jgi:iron complex outermembrane receptor protein